MSLQNQGLDPVKLQGVPSMKLAMVDGTFDYEGFRISGQYHETSGTFMVSEGHHRMVAALEVAAETGNWEPFRRARNAASGDAEHP